MLRRNAWWSVLAAIAGFAALILLGTTVVFDRPPRVEPADHDGRGLVRIDPSTRQVVARIPLDALVGLDVAEEGVWVSTAEAGFHTVVRVDPESNAPTRKTRVAPLASGAARNVAVGEGGVWAIAGDAVYRVDPREARAVRVPTFAPRSQLAAVAVGEGGVWVVDASAGTVYRLDPRTGEPVSRIPVADPAGVAVGLGAVWVTTISGGGGLVRIAPSSNRVVERRPVAGASYGIAAGADGVWITIPNRDAVAHLDRASGSLEEIRVGARPTAVAVSRETVWVANSADGTVSVLDPGRRSVVATIRVGTRPHLISAGETGVWVSLLGAPEPHRHEAD